MSDVRERVMLDRYAIRDISGEAGVGDLVVVSLKRFFERTGKDEESREIGKVLTVNEDGTYDINLVDDNKPPSDWEYLSNVTRNKFEVLKEKSWFDIADRVTEGAAEAYPGDEVYKKNLNQLLREEAFLSGGRILAGLGRKDNLDLTFFNCFVKQIPEDSRQGIVQHLGNVFEIFSRGGGCGWSLDIFRPRGSHVRGVNGRSSGPCSWAFLYSLLTETVEQGGSRRGASMQALSIWHPDVLEFSKIKGEHEIITCPHCGEPHRRLIGNWEGANVSIMIPDSFMRAYENDEEWEFVFPDTTDPEYNDVWRGDLDDWLKRGKKVDQYGSMPARELFNEIAYNAWFIGDPGLLFIDRMNAQSNSHYFRKLICTNPCGEVPLPVDGVCNLGHLNLSKYLLDGMDQFPTTEITYEEAIEKVDWGKLSTGVEVGVKFLNGITDLNKYHEEPMKESATAERRIGLGVLGLGELLIRLGLRYGSPECIRFIDHLFNHIKTDSYTTSIELAKTYGPFPSFQQDFLQSGFVKTLSPELRASIKEHGIRNITLNTVAPTGSVGTMVGTSTGLEPYIAKKWTARSRIGATQESINIWEELEEKFGEEDSWPEYVVTSGTVTPTEHVLMQATIQKHIDASVSKTINLPPDATEQDVRDAYLLAYKEGCKGITVFRDGCRGGDQVLFSEDTKPVVQEVVPEEASRDFDEVTVKIFAGHASNGSHGILRPKIRKGPSLTDSRETPIGTLHSTIRHHPVTGDPYDFFCESGGGDIGADTEAIARLISTIMRWPDNLEVPQLVRLQIIQDQLLGIKGRSQVGIGPEAIFSLPDGIAKAIKEFLQGDVPLAGLPTGLEKVEEFIKKVTSLKTPEEIREYIITGMVKHKSNCDCDDRCDCKRKSTGHESEGKTRRLEYCPQCGNATLVTDGGCSYCIDQQCNYSAC